MPETIPSIIAGAPDDAGERITVENKHSGAPAFAVARADAVAVRRAIDAAHESAPALAAAPAWRRAQALQAAADAVRAEREPLARTITIEVGKTIHESRAEVDRCFDTLSLAAQEASRITGEQLPLDGSPRGEAYDAVIRRVPIGPCALISPFNFPLNLAAHKMGPALAAACPFVLKPSLRAPVSALRLAAILAQRCADAGLPREACSAAACTDDDAEPLVTDPRLRLLSFTGSSKVGWMLRAKAEGKRVSLELGGVAPCIVDDDADLDLAADRITTGAFGVAGQSCISVQRILAHERIAPDLVELLRRRAERLVMGDPLDESTTLGPLISEDDAKRVESWIEDAARRGARVEFGGRRRARFIEPTLLSGAAPDAKLSCEEVFGPVAVLETWTDIERAFDRANATPYGLQAGLFTRRIDHALRAASRLEFGGVVINDVPTSRVDAMPYGGVKASGLGREGVRYAIEEMTERRTILIRRP